LLVLVSELVIMVPMGWTRLILKREKLVPVAMRTLESLLDLMFEFENLTEKALDVTAMPNEKL
jgi:hypothetical protein